MSLTTARTATLSRPSQESYEVTVKKGFFGRLTVTVVDLSRPQAHPKTATEKRIKDAAKHAIGSQLSRSEKVTLRVTARGTELTLEPPSFGPTTPSNRNHLISILGGALEKTAPHSAVDLLRGKPHQITVPTSAVDAIFHNLPNQKITIEQWKSYLCYSVRTSSNVNVTSVLEELKSAQDHDRNQFEVDLQDFKYDRGLFHRKQSMTPELMSRIEGLINNTEPMTAEGEKLIRQVYAHYINNSGPCLGEYFLTLVNIFCPKHSIFVQSENGIMWSTSQDPDHSIAYHSAFLFKKIGQPGYCTLSRDPQLNTKEETLRCPGTTVLHYKPSRTPHYGRPVVYITNATL